MFTRVESLKQLKARIVKLRSSVKADPDYIGHHAALDWQTKKYSLYIKQRGRCCFCKRHTYADSAHGPKKHIATLEHKICRTNGGSDSIRNLAISCWDCNNKRGTIDFDEFLNMIETHGIVKTYSIINQQRNKSEQQRLKRLARREENRNRFNTDVEFRNKILLMLETMPEKVRNNQKAYYGIVD